MKQLTRVFLVSIVLLLAVISTAFQAVANKTGRAYYFSATTAALGGSLLTIGTSVSNTTTVTGAAIGQPCSATPTDGTDLLALGAQVSCTVTSADTVTTRVFALVALTPPSKQYNLKVQQYP